LLEATHNPLMSAALTTPGWGKDHGDQMSRTRRLAYVGSIVPTEAVGRVVLSPWFGHEEVRFRMPDRDLGALEAGLRAATRILFEAGAVRVAMPNHQLRVLSSVDELARFDRLFTSSREISLGSAHPQGGNPMSDDPEIGAVDSHLAVHGFENLFVCDASVFPSSVGVNPIDTVFAIAHRAAPGIIACA
jgi:choline dehydrogenase-like flavoprotein